MTSQRVRNLEDGIRRDRRVWIALLILCAIGAAAVLRRIVALASPPAGNVSDLSSLDAHFAAKGGLILLHIVPSLFFVLLLPLQFVPSLRRNHLPFHRWNGRIVMAFGIIAGASALWLSRDPVGGLAEGSATIFFGAFFLFSLGKAWWHVRNKRIDLHREWATRMTAIALGVATTRPIMGIFFATRRLTGLTPEQFFGPAMWLGFVLTYLAGEAWISRRRLRIGQSNGPSNTAHQIEIIN